MYILTRFEVDGFWDNYNIQSDLRDDVNIFIGLNGTGKTTLVNLLQAALTVNVELLYSLSFKEIRLFLKQKSSTRRITITRQSGAIYDVVKYKISRYKFEIPLVPNDIDMRRRFHPRYFHDWSNIKENMSSLVKVSWLSVHRQTIINDEDSELPNRRRAREQLFNPVDNRLMHLLGKFSDYHLNLQAKANDISTEFQKRVLTSLLSSSTFNQSDFQRNDTDFDVLREQLYHAYEDLGIESDIHRRIDEHVARIQKSITVINEKTTKHEPLHFDDVLPYSLLSPTQKIVEFSMEADNKKRELFELINLFIFTINGFLDGKALALTPNNDYGISMTKDGKDIDFSLLSSGEKQLFILLVETVLQNRKQAIFIADEPELSLHVAWQRKLIEAVHKLNPNAQLIVATHSPEIAGPWREKLIKMRDVISK